MREMTTGELIGRLVAAGVDVNENAQKAVQVTLAYSNEIESAARKKMIEMTEEVVTLLPSGSKHGSGKVGAFIVGVLVAGAVAAFIYLYGHGFFAEYLR